MQSRMFHLRTGSAQGPCGLPSRARSRTLAILVLALATLAGCSGSKRGKRVKLPPPINPRIGWTQVGVASWYGNPYHGRKTSNGETYDMDKMTAAHKRLPFDTWLQVENLSNGAKTQVRINDRGPFVGKRIIDLSRAAATDIRMIGAGTARVRLTVIRPPSQNVREASGQTGNPRLPARGRQRDQFDIQVGVFSTRANADKMAGRIEKWGHSTNVLPFSQGSSQMFRVMVRGGSTKQANARLKRLKRQGVDGILRPRLD